MISSTQNTPHAICSTIVEIIDQSSPRDYTDLISRRLFAWKEKATLKVEEPECLVIELQDEILTNPLNRLSSLKHPVLERGWVWEKKTLDNYISFFSSYYTVYEESEDTSLVRCHPRLSPFDRQSIDVTAVSCHTLATQVIEALASFDPPPSLDLVLHVSNTEMVVSDFSYLFSYYGQLAQVFIAQHEMALTTWEFKKMTFRLIAINFESSQSVLENKKATTHLCEEMRGRWKETLRTVNNMQRSIEEHKASDVHKQEELKAECERKNEALKIEEQKNMGRLEELKCQLGRR